MWIITKSPDCTKIKFIDLSECREIYSELSTKTITFRFKRNSDYDSIQYSDVEKFNKAIEYLENVLKAQDPINIFSI